MSKCNSEAALVADLLNRFTAAFGGKYLGFDNVKGSEVIHLIRLTPDAPVMRCCKHGTKRGKSSPAAVMRRDTIKSLRLTLLSQGKDAYLQWLDIL